MDQSSINLFIGLLLGFVLSTLPRSIDRRRNLLSYWKVLRVEIDYCHECALGVRNAGVLSPLGRLPTTIYDEVFKHIVTEGDIEPADARTLIRYDDFVRQVNDSLDLINDAVTANNLDRAKKEYGRIQLKTDAFTIDAPDSRYIPAIELANRHCNKPWWKF